MKSLISFSNIKMIFLSKRHYNFALILILNYALVFAEHPRWGIFCNALFQTAKGPLSWYKVDCVCLRYCFSAVLAIEEYFLAWTNCEIVTQKNRFLTTTLTSTLSKLMSTMSKNLFQAQKARLCLMADKIPPWKEGMAFLKNFKANCLLQSIMWGKQLRKNLLFFCWCGLTPGV